MNYLNCMLLWIEQARCLFYVLRWSKFTRITVASNITLHFSGFKSQKIFYNHVKDCSPSIISTTSGFILIMSNRDRIRKKSTSKSNSQSNIDHLLGRPFSNGSLPRHGGLTQTQPFTPPENQLNPLPEKRFRRFFPS